MNTVKETKSLIFENHKKENKSIFSSNIFSSNFKAKENFFDTEKNLHTSSEKPSDSKAKENFFDTEKNLHTSSEKPSDFKAKENFIDTEEEFNEKETLEVNKKFLMYFFQEFIFWKKEADFLVDFILFFPDLKNLKIIFMNNLTKDFCQILKIFRRIYQNKKEGIKDQFILDEQNFSFFKKQLIIEHKKDNKYETINVSNKFEIIIYLFLKLTKIIKKLKISNEEFTIVKNLLFSEKEDLEKIETDEEIFEYVKKIEIKEKKAKEILCFLERILDLIKDFTNSFNSENTFSLVITPNFFEILKRNFSIRRFKTGSIFFCFLKENYLEEIKEKNYSLFFYDFQKNNNFIVENFSEELTLLILNIFISFILIITISKTKPHENFSFSFNSSKITKLLLDFFKNYFNKKNQDISIIDFFTVKNLDVFFKQN